MSNDVPPFTPPPLNHYRQLTTGGDVSTILTQDEACVVLKAYDYGLAGLNDDENQVMNSILGKLKDEIWP